MLIDLALGALKKLGNLVGGDLGKKVTGVIGELKEAVGKDPELEKAMLAQEVELKKIVAADLEGARRLIKSESKSEDPFVRRARPAFLWLFYVIIFFNFAVAPILQQIGVLGTLTYPELPQELYYLFGVSFTGYAGFRSYDKAKKKQ